MAESARAPVPFLGRVEAVEALHERLQEARSGRGGVTLLIGDTGVGKSTLLAELCQEIRGHGMRALVGRAPAVDEPPPFALVDDAIASRHDDPSVRAEEAPTMGGGSYLIGFAPHLQETSAPAPLGIEERLLELLGASDRRGKMSQDEILHHIAEPFLELTRHGPTAILLDDLDRADASSLDAVEFFATELQFRPMWILATSRSLGSLSEAGRARIEAFERRTGAARVHLPPMTTAEAAEFLRAIDPNRAISQEELERRFSESGGNPLLLQQMDRRRRSGSEETGGPGPDLPSLGEPAQEALDVASVLGPEFPFGWLLRASGTEEEPLTEAVEELVSSGVLFERPGEILEFPQERVRQAAYDAVSEVRRRRFHRRAGEALEEMGRGDANRTFALARHFYLGREIRKAVQYNRAAAAGAEAALAPDVAREHLARALECLRELPAPDRSQEWELVLDLARVEYDLGRLQPAEKVLTEFLAPTAEPADLPPAVRATIEVCLAQTLVARGDLPSAAKLAEKVLATPGIDDQPLVRIGAHHQLGQARYYDGRYPAALAEHTEEIRLAGALGNERVMAHAELWRAGILAMLGETDAAIAGARQVAVALDRLGSVRESGQGHLFLGNMLADTKAPEHREEALHELAEAARLGGKANDPRRVGWAAYHAAELLRSAGRLEEARSEVERACEILGGVGDRTGRCMSLKVRGQIESATGAYDLARADLEESHRVIRGLNQAMIEIDVILRMAELDLLQGRRLDAKERVDELARQNLPALRVDLVDDYDRLRRALGLGPTAPSG